MSKYYDLFLVDVQKKDDSNHYSFTGTVDSLKIPEGFEKDYESIAMLDGSRRMKRTPSPDIVVEMDMYPLDTRTGATTDLDAGTSVCYKGISAHELFEGGTLNHGVGSGTLTLTGTNNRADFRVTIALIDDPTALILAYGNSVANHYVKRYAFVEAKCIRARPDLGDMYDKTAVAFKIPPMDINAESNYYMDSTNLDISTTLTVASLNAYTSTNKW